ncbi:S1C family serine protease [Nitrospira sp. M1]
MTSRKRLVWFFAMAWLCISMDGIGGEAWSSELHDAVEQAKHATVGILRHNSDEMSQQSVQSQFAIRGSGVHLGEGYILTARHAVERTRGGKAEVPQAIHVLTDGLAELSAHLIGVNRFLDVALYQLDEDSYAGDLPFVSFEKETSRQGDEVFTVGYPLGWGPALSFGRMGNPQTFLPTAQSRLLQIDLSACSGNSGGGLFGTDGHLVGLIHAIIQTQTESRERRCSRFAFAIPGPLIVKIVTTLKSGKSYAFPRLGIRMKVMKVEQQWRVAAALAKGPARIAGVKKNDVLLAINETPITSAAELKSYLIEHTVPGQVIELRLLREETEKVLQVTLGKS